MGHTRTAPPVSTGTGTELNRSTEVKEFPKYFKFYKSMYSIIKISLSPTLYKSGSSGHNWLLLARNELCNITPCMCLESEQYSNPFGFNIGVVKGITVITPPVSPFTNSLNHLKKLILLTEFYLYKNLKENTLNSNLVKQELRRCKNLKFLCNKISIITMNK